MTNIQTYNLRKPARYSKPTPQSHQKGIIRYVVVVIMLIVTIVLAISVYKLIDHTHTSPPEVRSGIMGYCLDDYHDSTKLNAIVDSWACNGAPSQDWIMSDGSIKHGNNYCLVIKDDGKVSGDPIVLASCDGSPSQAWNHYLDGYQNPSSGLCLAIPDGAGAVDTQLIARTCNDMTSPNESWTPSLWLGVVADLSATTCAQNDEGARIACYANRQWLAWQSSSAIHETLLNDYTDGNPNEEWCADFVSYVYREAGYPFSDAERDSWDQYTAGDVQYMGFTVHSAAGYIPSPGDVAYFDYPGGHVEIVVSGGKHPTFIYGDAGTIDPATHNGAMAENSFTSDGAAGQVVYYLSPN